VESLFVVEANPMQTSCSACSKLGKLRPSTSSDLKVATQASASALS
jgi:hypothetical protein